MTKQEIPDNDITASSSKSGREPFMGRPGVGSWAPKDTDSTPYFQVVFPTLTTLTSISTRGGEDGGFVQNFQLQYSLDDQASDMTFVRENKSKDIKVSSRFILSKNNNTKIGHLPIIA